MAKPPDQPPPPADTKEMLFKTLLPEVGDSAVHVQQKQLKVMIENFKAQWGTLPSNAPEPLATE
jgi:hypothetical protein